MFLLKKSFTLIELLVVVLIIGILAAVAVPQYQKAVIKSRVFGYIPFVKSLMQAQEAYYLANGQYAVYFEDLDVNFPGSCKMQDDRYQNMIYCNDSVMIDNYSGSGLAKGAIMLRYCPQNAQSFRSCSDAQRFFIGFYLQHPQTENMKGKTLCSPTTGDSLAQQICTAFNAQYYQ